MLLQKLLATREANKALLQRRIDRITADTSNDELVNVIENIEKKEPEDLQLKEK